MRIEQVNLLKTSGQKRVETPKRDVVLSAAKRSDQIELSLSKPTIDALPDVREDRIKAARERIESGFYDRPEIRERIAGAFVKAQFA